MKKSPGKTLFLIAFILAMSVEFLYFMIIAPKKEAAIAKNLTHQREFRNGTSPLDKQGNPLWIFSSVEDTNWISDDLGMGQWYNPGSHVDWKDQYWVRIHINANTWKDPSLYFLARPQTFIAFYKTQLLTNQISGIQKSKTLSWTVIPLKNVSSNSYVYIHFPQGYNYRYHREIYFASQHSFMEHLITKDLVPFAAGLLFLITGVVALFLAFGRYRNSTISAFALFSLLVGIFTISRSSVGNILFNTDILFHSFFISMLFLTSVTIYFIEIVFELSCRSFIHKLWVTNLAIAFIATSLYIIDYSFFLPFIMLIYSLMTILSLIISGVIVLNIKNKNQEMLLFTAGFVVFIAYALGDLLSNFIQININFNLFWGMLWMELIIGKILLTQFNKVQDQLKEYSLNLESMVENRTDELQHANEELGETLSQLKGMQKKIIQQEKLASLGGLTAGIAHEIKNPLNFVNNFSTVSIELLEELKENLDMNKLSADDQELISDLEQSISKINDHGKRADGIVQSMLLHSRGTAGEFKKVDLNSILLEYSNLAYHGMRAQDSEFQVDLDVDLDPQIKEVSIVPQDISRAFLNIVNNACYAANHKRKTAAGDFVAKVNISSKKLDNGVQITIRDNGNGIPREIQDSIFDPFFTTKPAGDGTGLGLSISYDIIVSEHRGQLELDSKKGQYTEFKIWIPDQSVEQE